MFYFKYYANYYYSLKHQNLQFNCGFGVAYDKEISNVGLELSKNAIFRAFNHEKFYISRAKIEKGNKHFAC